MGFNYLSTVLSTIEKHFGIKSEETAWVFSGNEIRWKYLRNQYDGQWRWRLFLQPNLVHIRHSLPWSDKEETTLDLRVDDNDRLRAANLHNSFLHKGILSIRGRLEQGKFRGEILWTQCYRDGKSDEREEIWTSVLTLVLQTSRERCGGNDNNLHRIFYIRHRELILPFLRNSLHGRQHV